MSRVPSRSGVRSAESGQRVRRRSEIERRTNVGERDHSCAGRELALPRQLKPSMPVQPDLIGLVSSIGVLAVEEDVCEAGARWSVKRKATGVRRIQRRTSKTVSVYIYESIAMRCCKLARLGRVQRRSLPVFEIKIRPRAREHGCAGGRRTSRTSPPGCARPSATSSSRHPPRQDREDPVACLR